MWCVMVMGHSTTRLATDLVKTLLFWLDTHHGPTLSWKALCLVHYICLILDPSRCIQPFRQHSGLSPTIIDKNIDVIALVKIQWKQRLPYYASICYFTGWWLLRNTCSLLMLRSSAQLRMQIQTTCKLYHINVAIAWSVFKSRKVQ